MHRHSRRLAAASLAVAALAAGAAAQDRSDEDAVFAAALRQQIQEQLDSTERARGTVLCAAIDPGGAPQTPTAGVMKLLAGERQLRPLGACDRRATGAVEAQTRRPAVIVTVGPVEWMAKDDAHVAVSIYRSASSGAHRTYRVVKERTGWVSIGQVIKDWPLAPR
jgi:hypothetical protein